MSTELVATEPAEPAELAARKENAAALAVEAHGRLIVERVSIVAFFSMSAFLFWRLAHVASGADWWIVGAGAFAGYVGADLASGLVHWAFDTWGSETTPVLGKHFIVPFRVHHVDPKDITRHGFVPTNGNNCFVATPVLAATLLIHPAHEASGALFFASLLLFVCVGTMATNQFHKWAHEDAPPKYVAKLQGWHLILPIDHHDLHHRPPYEKHYCITTGWLNAPLNAIGFFRGLEKAITFLTGAKARRDDLAL